jgi:hypothetical protein
MASEIDTGAIAATGAAMLVDASALNKKYAKSQSVPIDGQVTIVQILRALNEFGEVIRYLNTRRSAGAVLTLDSEAAVQDALYLMLRPWVTDLIPESPTEKIANRFTIKDFVSASAKCVVEAKYVRDRDHGRHISREIHDDIETYRHHSYCRHLIFFIYDPDVLIPDRGALERQVQVRRVYDDVPLDCHLIVKP